VKTDLHAASKTPATTIANVDGMTNIDTTTTTTRPTASPAALPTGHDWETAGAAWGRRAADWACLFEHYATDVIQAIFPRVGIEQCTSVLDIACGSGLAIRIADGMGAATAGIDAATDLIAIARDRAPGADLRVGTMFDLPWSDESFDSVTSINGIWGGCDGALIEAFRVLRPGGRIGISFWGHGHLDLRPCFKAFALNAPESHLNGMRRTNNIARPGVAEQMLESAGFEVSERGSRISTLEWPDDETAWRAMSSSGPAVPALEHVGADVLRPQVLDALAGIKDRRGIYRFRNDHQFVIARKPD
jgi:SAM-dependent methyltransferase